MEQSVPLSLRLQDLAMPEAQQQLGPVTSSFQSHSLKSLKRTLKLTIIVLIGEE